MQAKILIVIMLLGIYTILTISFIFVQSDVYSYYGFVYGTDNLRVFLGFIILSFVIISFIIPKHNDFSLFFLSFYLLFNIIPLIVFFQFYKYFNTDILFAYLVVYSFLLLGTNIKIKVKTYQIRQDKVLPVLLGIILISVIPFIITYGPHLNLKNLLLSDIYVTRFAHRELGNTFTAYLYPWLTKIIIPITFITSLIYKKKSNVILVGGITVFMFLVGAHKAVFFSLFVLLFFYFFSVPKKIIYFFYGFSFLLMIGLLLALIFNYYTLDAIFSQRLMFMSILLDQMFFETFQEPIYYGHSFLSSIVDYKYTLKPDFLIGEKYFNNPEMRANNGIVSDGYVNLGMLGILLNSTIMLLLFSYFNSLRIDKRYYGVFFLLLLTLKSSPLFTAFLTQGVLILILISQFFLKDSDLTSK